MNESNLRQFLEHARQYLFELIAPAASPALIPVRIATPDRPLR